MQDRNAPAQLRKIDYIQSKTSRRLKIGLCMRSYDGHTPHPDISDRVLAMAKLCDELGHHVEEAEWRINADHLRRSFVVNWESAAAAIVRKTEEALGCYPGTAVLEPWTLGLAERFFCEHVNELGAAQRYFVEAADEFRRMFAPYDALLCPVTPDLQPLLGAVSPDRPFDELEATAFRHCAYTLPANVFGCPAVSIPSGFSQDGILPIGSQFFADVGREDVLLHLAYEIEEAAPWKRLPSLTMSLMGLAV